MLVIRDIQSITHGTNGFDCQAVDDSTDNQAATQADAGVAYVVSGMQVTQNTGSNMLVSVASGKYVINGIEYTYAGGTATIGAASATDRRDIVSIDTSAALHVTAGVACGTAGWTQNSSNLPPVKPAIPTNQCLLGEVSVLSTTTAIANINIVDKTTVVQPINGIGTPNSASQALTAGTVGLITGTLIKLGTGEIQVGSRFRFVLNVNKTAAGTAAWTLTVRFGTAGTNADAAIATWTSGTNTAAIDKALLIIEVYVTAIGATATAACTAFYVNQLTNATGLGDIAYAPGSTTTFNANATNPFLHVDITPGTSAVMTAVGQAERLG